MNTNDIKHLANLSRLHLEEKEINAYTEQFDHIVAYVDKIKEISSDGDESQFSDETPINILREDEVLLQSKPEKIIDEAPSHQDNFVKVKKILQQ